MPPPDDDFSTYRRLIMSEFERLHEQVADLQKDVRDLSTSVTVLKVKAALIGGFSGILVSAVTSGLLSAIAHAITGAG